jgi:transposase
MNVTTVGLDLAKNVFHMVGLNAQGQEKMKKRLSRGQVLKYLANTPSCSIGMEACAGAHYFARELTQLGHEAKLIPPQYVKAYVRGQKNDTNDARAIAEAVRAPQMRFVAAKTVAQQDLQALARLREGTLRARTALANRLHGSQYRRGREASAAVGLVPRQHSTGGKSRLLGISKRGDRYLRCLLVHGARSVVIAAERKDDPLSRWINRLRETRGINKATVVLANKLTRIGWAVLRNNAVYQPACRAS